MLNSSHCYDVEICHMREIIPGKLLNVVYRCRAYAFRVVFKCHTSYDADTHVIHTLRQDTTKR